MTGFLAQEVVDYCRDNKSKLFASYLDCKQAFDRVWHDGLLFKLHELGISHQLCLSVASMHADMYSCVLYKGFKSRSFPIKQETRQGGRWSPFLYLCYINDLIDDIGSKFFCAPTVADDMLLFSLSACGLQSMIDICLNYSC